MAKARSFTLLSHGSGRGPRTLATFGPLYPTPLAENWILSGASGTQICTHMRCQHERGSLTPVSHAVTKWKYVDISSECHKQSHYAPPYPKRFSKHFQFLLLMLHNHFYAKRKNLIKVRMKYE